MDTDTHHTVMATNTPDTTRIDGVIFGLPMAVLALVMVLYCVPQISPVWTYAKAEAEYTRVARGDIPGDLELDALTGALRRSGKPSDLSRAAHAQLIRAQQLGLRSVRALPWLTAARRDLLKGVSAAPADAYAWTRLAVVEMYLSNTAPAARALEMALQLAPAERKLTAIQFDLAVVLWPQLEPAARSSIAQRLRWARYLPELKAALSGNSAKTLERLLAETPAPR